MNRSSHLIDSKEKNKNFISQVPNCANQLISPGATNTQNSDFIFIIDTGVELGNPDLNVVQFDGVSKSFVESDEDPWLNCLPILASNLTYHGTAMAHMAAAIDNNIGTVGTSPSAPIASIRIFGCDMSAPADSILSAFNYLAFITVPNDIFNMSFALLNSTFCGSSSSFIDPLVEIGLSNGFMSVSAGNDSTFIDLINASPACLGSFSIPNFFVIGAMQCDTCAFAIYSNYGSEISHVVPSPVEIPVANSDGTNSIIFNFGGGSSSAAASFSGLIHRTKDYFSSCELYGPDRDIYSIATYFKCTSTCDIPVGPVPDPSSEL